TLPPAQEDRLALLEGRMDLVMIDAPCSGTGVWRRRPDSKWRLTPAHLGQQIKVQGELLMKGAALVKPGGSLAYITCSVLPEENCDRIEDFLAGNPGFHAVDLTEGAANILSHPLARAKTADIDKTGLLLTPARYETDGFFIALLKKDEA
ncbi:MAG TPA: MFS transporter, partial [Hyphomicrobiales bacterium]|nr:MFS transporter [Hyphomicrobiales bacterium]